MRFQNGEIFRFLQVDNEVTEDDLEPQSPLPHSMKQIYLMSRC